ncbi:MAG: peptidoglycan DD-metalloendopeptidase family protein [Rhodospirillales bacterium]|nr:peptidoglycan DD-metalloendopeptidase family protein [Rhodospirillales bacterium]
MAQTVQSESRLQEIQNAIEKEQKESQTRREKAAALAKEVRTLRRQLIEAARVTQNFEAEVTGIEDRLAELSTAESVKTAKLAERREQFVRVLMALQRMARHPPEALIVQPLDATSLVRSAILLRTAVPEIENHTAELRNEITELETLREQAKKKRGDLAAATSGMKKERLRLDGLIEKKQALKRQADSESNKASRRVEHLARQAKDLRDLMDRIEAERKARVEKERKAKEVSERLAKTEAERQAKDEAEKQARQERESQEARARAEKTERKVVSVPLSREAIGIGKGAELVPITRARGKLPFPVSGRLVSRYGQSSANGMTQKGISIETRDGAWVIAPYDGLVVFAGQFRGYGQILILEHGEGYHTLLAGLTRIDTVLGQWLAAGEPVGLMEKGDRDNPVLYVELRRNGQPINPLPWLASQKDKVSG